MVAALCQLARQFPIPASQVQDRFVPTKRAEHVAARRAGCGAVWLKKSHRNGCRNPD